MADAFGAFVGMDFVDFYALVDRIIGALGLTHVAVDALIGNHQGHKSPALFFQRVPHALGDERAGIAAVQRDFPHMGGGYKRLLGLGG
jgi:hypothetical protein